MYTSKNYLRWNNYLKELYNEILGKGFVDDCITCYDGKKNLNYIRELMKLDDEDKIIMFDDRDP